MSDWHLSSDDLIDVASDIREIIARIGELDIAIAYGERTRLKRAAEVLEQLATAATAIKLRRMR